MNRNEKILAGIVVSLFLLIGVGYAVRGVGNAFGLKRRQVSQWEKDISDKNQFDQFTQEHRDRLDIYRSRSLPSDPEEARRQYQNWLVDLAVEFDLEVKQALTPTSSDVYERLRFTVTGEGDLMQMVEFLHEFYSVDYLHRISLMRVTRDPRIKQLDLSFTVDALSLPTATNEKLTEEPSDRLAHGDFEAYRDAIVYRNLFGPPNNEPTIDPLDEIVGYKGQTVRFTAHTSDPDKLDKVRVRINGDGLPGASMDEESGEFEWVPGEIGKYPVEFEATDTGWPPKSVSQTVTINVTEAPPEKERVFDFASAKFAYVTGFTEADGEKLAWINLRTEGKVLLLSEGDEFVVGEVNVTVRRITEETVELEATVLKKRLLVTMGQNLAEGSLLPSEEG